MRKTLLVAGMCALACVLALAAPQGRQPMQTPARDAGLAVAGTGVLGGRVTTDDSAARPIRRATITLSGGGLRTPLLSLTDEEGRFIFRSLAAGSYAVSADKAPYLHTAYGARRPGAGVGTPIALAAGQQLVTLQITMPVGAVVAGTVADHTGRPASNQRVQLFDVRMVSGERVLTPAVGAAQGGVSTDDRGAYRIFGLAPGEYTVGTSSPNQPDMRLMSDDEIQWVQQQLQQTGRGGAQPASGGKPPVPGSGPTVSYSGVYYPSTVDAANAGTFTLALGEVRTGVDIALLLVPTAKIEGIVVRPDGQPAPSVQVTLTGAMRGVLAGPIPARGTDRDGKFSLPGIMPGAYTLSVRSGDRAMPPPNAGADSPVRVAPPSSAGNLWAMAEVNVIGQDVTGLSVTLQAGMTVSGRFVLENTSQTPLPDFSQARVAVGPAPGATPFPGGAFTQSANADGTFTVEGVPPGRYRITAGVPSAPGSSVRWVAMSAMVGGKDSFDFPFEVLPGQNVTDVVMTFADRYAELSGTLVDAAGQPAMGYMVLVFTTDKTMWTQGSRRTRQLSPNASGRFLVANLPAGEYYLAAVTDLLPPDLYDSTFLTQVAAAALKFTLADGEKKVQDLRIR